MSVASIPFLAFLACAWIVHDLLPERLRSRWLLVASYAFYVVAGGPQLLVVLLAATGIAWAGGRRMAAAPSVRERQAIFWTATGLELSLLVALKYVPVLLRAMGALTAPPNGLFVALGVSYFVFQAISYLADVYLETHPPERDLEPFALYLAFFPKLLQGPIERAGDLLPQLRGPYRFDYANARDGLVLVAWGLFEKLVVADRAAPFVDAVYAEPSRHSGPALLVATYYFAVQILFDFAGYTDIALGAARLFGIGLTQNFDAPYLATSVAEFWRRWHISFSRWLLDYVFRPLQLAWRDLGTWGTALALLATFVVSGVWHGPTWGFVAWGALHGLYLAGDVLYRGLEKRARRKLGLRSVQAPRVVQVVVTFHLVCAAWVFFRASTLRDALHVLTAAWALPAPGAPVARWAVEALLLGRSPAELLVLAGAVGVALLVGVLRRRGPAIPAAPLRWAGYALLALALLLFHAPASAAFLYARF